MVSTPEMPQQQLLSLFQQGRYREVLQRADALDLRLGQDPLAAQIVAGALFQLGEFGKASQLLEPHQAALGADGSYLSLYGATCRRLGQLAQARDLLGRALALDPLSPQIRNNYANLLIDLGELAEARRLLEALLAENPTYEDARANLNRLQFREQQQAPAATVPAATVQSWMPQDPLMLAFAEEEVRQAGGVAVAAPPTHSAAGLARQFPDPDQAAVAADQLKLAAQSIQENNPGFALQLVSQAGLALGAQAAVYVNAADAYIRLQRFHEAEICLLHALQLGGPALPHFINLISLASIRGDLALARHYLDAAAAIDPKHPQLIQVREQLQRQQATNQAPYRFIEHWAAPELVPA
jgi:Flp pilus assembly protein TadD